MAQLHAGTSGWAYPSWKPEFYPAKLPQRSFLQYYATQVITHIKRLKKTEDFIPRFLSTIEPLAQAGKLGPVLFQLPPNLKADAKLLEEFLAVLPRGVVSAFEFRHASWFADEIFALLKSCNRALCVAETGERVTPDVVTADFCYYRYRKASYTPEER